MDLEVDENMCYGCYGRMDDVYVEWVECGACMKWYHVKCTNDDSLNGKSMQEIEAMLYICNSCDN